MKSGKYLLFCFLSKQDIFLANLKRFDNTMILHLQNAKENCKNFLIAMSTC